MEKLMRSILLAAVAATAFAEGSGPRKHSSP
jgi:hypothetical protein